MTALRVAGLIVGALLTLVGLVAIVRFRIQARAERRSSVDLLLTNLAKRHGVTADELINRAKRETKW